MRKLICLMVFVIATMMSLEAQTKSISGTVESAQSGEPLIGATIMEVGGRGHGTVTDADGRFTLNGVASGGALEVSYVGYTTKLVNLKKTHPNPLVIKLQTKAMGLNEVVVVGKSEAREIKEHAMPVTVITMEQLKGTVSNVNDVLKRTTGITIRSMGGVGSAARVSVRGLEGKRIGVFIDDYPMNDNSDFISINDIPVEMIERIEIYKGVVPAKFGGSSVGGAVNIVTKEYPPKYLDANYTYGSFNTHKASLVLKRNIEEKGLEFGGGGFYDYSDNDYTMKSPLSDRTIVRDHDKYSKLTGALTFTARKWWFDEVEGEFVYINTKQQLQGVEHNVQHAHNYSHAGIAVISLKKQDFFLEGLDLDMTNAGVYTDYNFIDTASYRTDWDGGKYPAVSQYGGETNNWASLLNRKKTNFSNKTNLEYLITGNHSLNLNSVFTYANGNPIDEMKTKTLGYETNFQSRMNSWVVGLSYDYRDINDKFLNSINVKYYQYAMSTTLASIVSPKPEDINVSKQDVGVVNSMRYRITPAMMAKLSAGYDVRLPAENELLGDGYIIAPAGNLLPERNTSVNLGFLYDQTGRKPSNLQIELSGYWMYLEDMIRLTGGTLQSQYINFGEMQTFGVEAEVKADMTKWLYGYVNATFQDLRDVREYEINSTNPNPTKGMRMPNIPNLMANAGLEFHKENLFGGEGMNTRISVDGSFIEEYHYDFELSIYQDRKIPRSLSFDVGVEQSFGDGRYFIIATLFNATNATKISEFNRPLPGRHFNVRLRYVFK